MSVARELVAPGKFPGADDFQTIDIRQIAGKRCKRRGQADDALRGLIEQRLAGGFEHQHLIQRTVAVDRDHQAQIAVDLLASCFFGVVEVADALDLLAPLVLVPGALSRMVEAALKR